MSSTGQHHQQQQQQRWNRGGRGGDNKSKRRGGGRGGRGRGRNNGRNGSRGRGGNQQQPSTTTPNKHKILLLHGNHQTGSLLHSRISKLEKKCNIQFISIDAPHIAESQFEEENDEEEESKVAIMNTWWHYRNNFALYQGLETSLDLVSKTWMAELENNDDGEEGFRGILGFSQGARLAHFITLLHISSQKKLFPDLRFVIFVSGFDKPLPSNFPSSFQNIPLLDISITNQQKMDVPSLHIMGESDNLISVEESMELSERYENAMVYKHEKGHIVPVRVVDVDIYQQFLHNISNDSNNSDENDGKIKSKHEDSSLDGNKQTKSSNMDSSKNSFISKSKTEKEEKISATKTKQKVESYQEPDEEHALIQIDETEALSLIYPDEFTLLSPSSTNLLDNNDDDDDDDTKNYTHPISYKLHLTSSTPALPKPLDLQITYTTNYPDTIPNVSFIHDMNRLEFSSVQEKTLKKEIEDGWKEEEGMPCIMGIHQRLQDFLENGGLNDLNEAIIEKEDEEDVTEEEDVEEELNEETQEKNKLLPSVSKAQIQKCNLQGLEIAQILLSTHKAQLSTLSPEEHLSSSGSGYKGGSWKYAIGLVGKPSAGKSTFFNVATAFARQRGDSSVDKKTDDKKESIGGATMAPHPFTTIDPNVGYCLVPAPLHSCPEEEDYNKGDMEIATTHGRDDKGRRLLPVLLKDVAGLVPGAYRGRGRGNKFLDDLTDADVLIHVVDASGSADAEGNTMAYSKEDDDKDNGIEQNEDENDGGSNGGTHPLNDVSFVENELIQWLYFNLACKWDNIARRGKTKLLGMFSGYNQSQSFVWDVLLTVEKYLEKYEKRDHALDHLDEWDEGDLHRLVSAFMGSRFPTALALNKVDIPSSNGLVKDVLDALPVHGAHVGVPLSARREMRFVRKYIQAAIRGDKGTEEGGKVEGNPSAVKEEDDNESSLPNGVWQCLQSAMQLREPVLVFPVSDMTTYEPLPGMMDVATRDASLPNKGMISCLRASGGTAPTLWDDNRGIYVPKSSSVCSSQQQHGRQPLRDCIVMKPGSTVEDVFLVLKHIGAIGGEFVRAEGAGRIGEKPKLVPKSDNVGKNNRILHIMTNKRREWQKQKGGGS